MVMAGKKNDELKKYLNDILGVKTSFKKKRPSIQDRNKNHVCKILKSLHFINVRSIGMKHDYKVDMIEYEEPFFNIIDSFLKIHFNQEQQNIINWWLYDKFLPTGDVLNLIDKETDDEIPTTTPEDIYYLIKSLEKNEGKISF
jgi:hypothetical protein